MANYLVLTSRVAGHKPGDVITDDDLTGANIDALIYAGHISTQSAKKSAKTKDIETKD